MVKGMVLRGREQRAVDEVKEALGESIHLRPMLKEAFPLLLSLVGADYGALVVPRAEGTDLPTWIEFNLSPAFLGAYAEMMQHDFVLTSVLKNPRMVVRDSEMISRSDLEKNMMFHRAREVGSPIAQVMAVMLHAQGDFRSGFSVYRARPRPFSERDQRMLQEVTRTMVNAVRNCCEHLMSQQVSARREAILSSGKGAVFMQPPAREVDRTAHATVLLDTWFARDEYRGGSLPQVLLDELARAQTERKRGHVGSLYWGRRGDESDLKVELCPLPEKGGEASWVLIFREVPHVLPVPAAWAASLTGAEREVVSRVLRGWDNQLIAQDLRCKPNTVKKHVQRACDKLGLADRKMLLAQALLDA